MNDDSWSAAMNSTEREMGGGFTFLYFTLPIPSSYFFYIIFGSFCSFSFSVSKFLFYFIFSYFTKSLRIVLISCGYK